MLMANKTYQPNDVITFKLTTGEEVVARLADESDNIYNLTKPMAIIPTPQGGLGLAPLAFSLDTKENVVLNKHAVAVHGRTEKDLANQYLQKTTGLTLVNS